MKNIENFISPEAAVFRFTDFCRAHNSCRECKYKHVQLQQEHLGNHLGSFMCCIYWLFEEVEEKKENEKL